MLTYTRIHHACNVESGILKGGDFVIETPQSRDLVKDDKPLPCLASIHFVHGQEGRSIVIDIYPDYTFVARTAPLITIGISRPIIWAYHRAYLMIEALGLEDRKA